MSQAIVKPYEYNYPVQCPVPECMYHVCLLTTIVGQCMGRWKVETVVGIGEYVTPSTRYAQSKHGSECIILDLAVHVCYFWSLNPELIQINLILHRATMP